MVVIILNRGFFLKTDSIESIVNTLIEKGVNNDASKNPFGRIK